MLSSDISFFNDKKIKNYYGVCYGTYFNEKFGAIVMRTKRIEDIYKFQLFKYVFAGNSNSFNNVEAYLKNINASCQIDSLVRFLGKNMSL